MRSMPCTDFWTRWTPREGHGRPPDGYDVSVAHAVAARLYGLYKQGLG